MFIKCENCSKVYDVSDEKYLMQKPHFFKCFACGCMFKSPIASDDLIQEKPDDVMPLSEIFVPTENSTEDELTVDESKKREPITSKISQSAVFEPIKQKRNFWPRVVLGASAGLVAFLVMLLMLFAARLYVNALVSSAYDEGFVFKDTEFKVTKGKGLNIFSTLINASETGKITPVVVVLITDKKGRKIDQKKVFLNKYEMLPHEKLPFNIDIKRIHPKAYKIEILMEKQK